MTKAITSVVDTFVQSVSEQPKFGIDTTGTYETKSACDENKI